MPGFIQDSILSCKDSRGFRAMLVHQLLPFFATSDGWTMLLGTQPTLEGYCIEIDCQQLKERCKSPDLAAALDMQPLEGLSCLQAGVHEVKDLYLSCYKIRYKKPQIAGSRG